MNDELIETRFAHTLVPEPRRSIRGKSGGAYVHCGSFQWTSAVKGLALLFLKAAADRLGGFESLTPLSGCRGSLAASLDYAIAKEPEWIIDVFGADSKGTPIIRRLVRITNPNQKRPGPVALCLNQSFLPSAAISITVAGIEVQSLEAINRMIGKIETEHNQALALRGASTCISAGVSDSSNLEPFIHK